MKETTNTTEVSDEFINYMPAMPDVSGKGSLLRRFGRKLFQQE